MNWGRIGRRLYTFAHPSVPARRFFRVQIVCPAEIFCLSCAVIRSADAPFASRLAAWIRDVFQELQILLRDEEAAEDLVAPPLEKQRLTGKRPGR